MKIPVYPNDACAVCKTKKPKCLEVPNKVCTSNSSVTGCMKIPNDAYAVCKTKKPRGLVVPNKACTSNRSVTGCMKIPVYPNEVYALSKRVEEQQV